jgi:hypothetical protein
MNFMAVRLILRKWRHFEGKKKQFKLCVLRKKKKHLNLKKQSNKYKQFVVFFYSKYLHFLKMSGTTIKLRDRVSTKVLSQDLSQKPRFVDFGKICNCHPNLCFFVAHLICEFCKLWETDKLKTKYAVPKHLTLSYGLESKCA